MSTHLLVNAFMLIVSIWCGHLAGVSYVLSREDKKYKRSAITRSVLSVAAAGFVLYFGQGS